MALDRLRRAGVSIKPRRIDGTETIIEAYVDISLPEAANWHASTLDARPGDYQRPVRERLEFGRTISAVKYLHARDTRDALTHAVDAALGRCDGLVLPTLPIVAPTLGSSDVTMDSGDKLAVRAAMLRLTQLFNVTGNPAISLPIPTKGLPVGLQLVGRRGETEALLSTALACERILNQELV